MYFSVNPNYWVPTNYFIDWSEWALNRMQTLTIRERNRLQNKSGGTDTIAAVIRNADSYFIKGITFSRTGVYAPTFRLGCNAIFDTEGSTLFFNSFTSIKSILGINSSHIIKFQLKAFIGHTVHAQVDELKEVYFPIEGNQKLDNLVNNIIQNQKQDIRYDYASNEQLEIDRLVYKAYGLNEADIKEVENWYARRYPKLVSAQRRNLAIKEGKTEAELLQRPEIRFYCDESCHLPNDGQPHMLLGLIACPAEKVRGYHLELRDLCHSHGVDDGYEMKWVNVREGKLALYQAVLDWFLEKEDVRFRALLLSDKGEVFHRLPEDSQDAAYYRLYTHLLYSGIEPSEACYRIFLDQKDTQGGKKQQQLAALLQEKIDDPEYEILLGLQQMQSHEARLLQLTDLLLGIVGTARRTSPESPPPAPKQELIVQLSKGIGLPLTWDTESLTEKCVVSTFQDIDSLLTL